MKKNYGSSSSSNLDYRLRLPMGYRFKPTNHELLLILHHKIYHGETLIQGIRDVDLYKSDPQMLTEKYPPVGDREWYFFTPRDRKYRNGSRPNRCVSTGGVWKGLAVDTEVKHRGKIVGYRKNLSFHYGKSNDGDAIKTKWMMQEFRAKHSPWTTAKTPANHSNVLDEWVLCRVYDNERKVEEELIDQTVGSERNTILPRYYMNGSRLDDVSARMMLGENLSFNPPLPPSLHDHQFSDNINFQNLYNTPPSLDLDHHLLPAPADWPSNTHPSLDLDYLLPAASDWPSNTAPHWTTITHANHINLEDGVWGRAYENCDNSGAAAVEEINTSYQTFDNDFFINPEFYHGSGSMMNGEDFGFPTF